MKAARSAQAEANNNDARKRLMAVPDCHVNRLQVQGGRIVAVDTNQGTVAVPANGKVIVALGTIESPAGPELLRRAAGHPTPGQQPDGAPSLQPDHPDSPRRAGRSGWGAARPAGGRPVLQVPPPVR
jgi:hypothetical protein